MKVTAVVPKSDPTPTSVSLREFDAVDRFARAVGDAIRTEVAVIEGTIDDAPDGYVLAFRLPSYVDVTDGSRIIAIGIDRSAIMEQVEAQRLAGAVEFHRYFEWEARPGQERGQGLVGRKDLAERLNARALASDAVSDLPSLIAAYLTALSQVGP
jgi:hypothetical protein